MKVYYSSFVVLSASRNTMFSVTTVNWPDMYTQGQVCWPQVCRNFSLCSAQLQGKPWDMELDESQAYFQVTLILYAQLIGPRFTQGESSIRFCIWLRELDIIFSFLFGTSKFKWSNSSWARKALGQFIFLGFHCFFQRIR